MNLRALRIERIERQRKDGLPEYLALKPGLNLLVGPPNTGKSVWLRMIDYALGDPERFDQRFDHALTHEYSEITASIIVGADCMTLTRRWWPQTIGPPSILVNSRPFPARRFQRILLSKLGIPLLYFSRGSGSQEAPVELSWRMLMRHIHRQQRFWGDIADKQYPKEEGASILQFLGTAEQIFSSDKSEAASIQHAIESAASEGKHIKGAIVVVGKAIHPEANWDEVNITQTLRRLMDETDAEASETSTQGQILKAAHSRNALDHDELNEMLRFAYLRGKLIERKKTLAAIADLDERRQKVLHLIVEKERELESLKRQLLDEHHTSLSKLVCGMNFYLQRLNELHPGSWLHQFVEAEASNGRVVFKLGSLPWSRALGGTDSLFFLMAYHYGLMSLSIDPECHYPGFALVDLPAEFKGHKLTDRDSHVLEPFVELFRQAGYEDCQLIVASPNYSPRAKR